MLNHLVHKVVSSSTCQYTADEHLAPQRGVDQTEPPGTQSICAYSMCLSLENLCHKCNIHTPGGGAPSLSAPLLDVCSTHES